MLNEYYVGIAKIVGSPRVRDTIFRTAKMIARLKLKNFVDVDDAKEACQFYNVILNEYDHIVNIPADPKEVSFIEFLYTIEATQAPILFEEAVSQTCKRNEYVATYIGNSYKLRNNKKLRQILDRLLEDSRIKRVQTKPIILQWISKDQPKKGIHSNKGKNNREDPSDDVTNVTHVTRSQVHTDEKDSLQDKNFLKKAEGKDVTRAHRAHRSYSIEEDSRYRQLENAKYEFEMGLYKEYGIKKAGNWWTCTYPKCSIKGHDKFAAAIHVMNVHETEEVKANLGILKGDSQDTQQWELRQYSREQLDMLLAQAEHGSPLEKEILLARDDLIDGGRS